MGATYYTYAVLGVEIDPARLTMQHQVRGCNHPLPPCVPQKFCPECGKPTWREEQQDIPAYDRDRDKLAGLDVATTTDRARCFVGMVVAAHDEAARIATDAALDNVLRIRDALQRFGLWDEKRFGFWAVQRCSY